MLTDIVFVELPPPGKKVKAGEPLAVVESVKSVSEVYAPVGGLVAEVNGVLEEKPELVNQDAFGAGWMVRLKMDDPAELSGLMDAAAYEELVAQVDH
jgi:glycine cleavage system H protein